jgi:RNA polymerase sigma factor (TIGR02999 family)
MEAGDGNPHASAVLLPLVYEELRKLAAARMNAEREDHTLQATALVHEAYLRMVGAADLQWANRAHFFAAAAEAMRRILIEHARAQQGPRRGGNRRKLPIDVLDLAAADDPQQIMALDDAISRLEKEDAKAARVVRLRFYAGLSVEEVAVAMQISPRTVKRNWSFENPPSPICFMAEQESPIRRRVALKIIKLGMDTKQVIARFEAERQALAVMEHPNIAKVFDAGTTETGRPYFVMELVRGMPITEYCDNQKLTTRQRVELFTQVCHAIQHAHQKGIIHRDIKPSNVLVTMHDDKPVPKVIDFGIVKAIAAPLTDKTLFTEFRQFMGTPAYMSPEQAQLNELDVDTRSDIYSLGVLFYELLTGTTPFSTRELKMAAYDEIRRIIREVEPPKPSTRISSLAGDTLSTVAGQRQTDPKRLQQTVRGDLDWIVMKCLEKNRTRRYETATGLGQDIVRHLNNEPIVARPPSSAYRFRKLVQRNKLAFVAAALILIILVLGICGSTFEAIRAARARDAAQASQASEAAQRIRAEGALLDSEAARANGLVAEADALRLAGRLWDCRQKMQEAYNRFVQAKLSPLKAELGLYDLNSQFPPSLTTYSNTSECQKFITPTIAENLDEARGFGLHLTLANQFPRKLLNAGKHGQAMYDSIIANAGNKVVFRLEHPEDAKTLAQWLFMHTFDPDQVKLILKSTKVMGYKEEMRESHTEGTSSTKGTSRGRGGGSFHGISAGDDLSGSQSFDSDDMSEPLSSVEGWNNYVANSSGSSESWQEGESEAQGRSESVTRSSVLVPQMGQEVSSVQYRSIDEQLFRATQKLFDQEDRRFAVRFHQGPKAPLFVKTPTVAPASVRQERIEEYRQRLLKNLSFARPMPEAAKRIEEREQKLVAEFINVTSAEPATARGRAKKRTW